PPAGPCRRSDRCPVRRGWGVTGRYWPVPRCPGSRYRCLPRPPCQAPLPRPGHRGRSGQRDGSIKLPRGEADLEAREGLLEELLLLLVEIATGLLLQRRERVDQRLGELTGLGEPSTLCTRRQSAVEGRVRLGREAHDQGYEVRIHVPRW